MTRTIDTAKLKELDGSVFQYNRSNHPAPLWDDSLIRRHDLTGPRYTSYPTAPQFSDDFTEQNWQSAMMRSNAKGNPLSLYVHIPFCDTVCYYCGCNKIITADKKRAEPYLNALQTEIDMQAAWVDTRRPLLQLHLGGGTPTYISDDQLKALIRKIQQHFHWQSDDSGEYSIEIHPQTVTPERLGFLRELGFNRLSLGVQDFNPRVQRAVNRFNSEQEVKDLIIAARHYQYKAISLDLIYGLPHQTCDSFATTLNQVIALRPDRLSLFNYAHMPELFKVQKQIDAQTLPEPQDKLTMLHDSIIQLTRAGYIYIGMDHFALPDDELAILQKQGALHRNFQGYATHGNCDLMAFGVSAISALDNTFAQNHKAIAPYIAAINSQQLPIHRGLTLSDDDLLRKAVINQLICHFTLDYATIEKKFSIHFASYFAPELETLKHLADDHLLDMQAYGFTVKATGRLLIRRICMVFDRYLQANINGSRYSRII
ncbi:oxygen-independent coproporphyrinogen III oxidase [Marinagarivorans algicola]|uniref:oxygen-independent coproporphyrinogen III oxidase n=1 Tax=Marinagarivorans algicola TaxID=1513270 RepID=UPI00373676AE